MSKKITTIAPANIAFIKYWGRVDHELFIPTNDSLSMNLSGCITKTTVEVSPDFEDDSVQVKFYGKDFTELDRSEIKVKNLFDQIERIRNLAGSELKVKVMSENNFPADSGIASSASGFAALTGALLLAFDLTDEYEDKAEFSRQIRLCGSGSAIRSGLDGFVEFLAGDGTHENSFAVQLADENHWDLVDIVAIVNSSKKKISSSEGHQTAETSPYFKTRLKEMQPRIERIKKAVLEKDFSTFGKCIEEDSTSMHSVMMTQNPPAFYWESGSITIMKEVMKWRDENEVEAYFTLDAGANVHVLCEKKDADIVKQKLEDLDCVQWTIYNQNCKGVQTSEEHLF